MSESNPNDDNSESDVSMIDAMASVTDGCQVIFWLFFGGVYGRDDHLSFVEYSG